MTTYMALLAMVVAAADASIRPVEDGCADRIADLAENGHCRIYADGTLVGIGRRAQGLIRFDVGLTGGN